MARARSTVVPFRRRRTRAKRAGGWFSPIMVMLPLAAFTAVFLWEGPPPGFALPVDPPAATGLDRETARFGLCNGMGRGGGDCVIDGDTFWYRGQKVRIADINTPETSRPGCVAEAQLGAAATERLQALLNQGAFTLEPVDRDRDKYDRLLRTVTREDASLGGVLVSEGLAEEWQGYRRDWC